MMMECIETYGKAHFEVSENVITRTIPVFDNYGNQTGFVREPIMDKETFLKCYHEWMEKEIDNESDN